MPRPRQTWCDALGTLGAVNLYTASSSAYKRRVIGGPARVGAITLPALIRSRQTMGRAQDPSSNTYGARVLSDRTTPRHRNALLQALGRLRPSETTITVTSVAGSASTIVRNLAPPHCFQPHQRGDRGGVTVNSVTYTTDKSEYQRLNGSATP